MIRSGCRPGVLAVGDQVGHASVVLPWKDALGSGRWGEGEERARGVYSGVVLVRVVEGGVDIYRGRVDYLQSHDGLPTRTEYGGRVSVVDRAVGVLSDLTGQYVLVQYVR